MDEEVTMDTYMTPLHGDCNCQKCLQGIIDKQAEQLKALERRRANEVYELQKTIEALKQQHRCEIKATKRKMEQ